MSKVIEAKVEKVAQKSKPKKEEFWEIYVWDNDVWDYKGRWDIKESAEIDAADLGGECRVIHIVLE